MGAADATRAIAHAVSYRSLRWAERQAAWRAAARAAVHCARKTAVFLIPWGFSP